MCTRRAVPALLLALFAAPVPAQTYPTKPVRIVMPFPTGGTNDIVARALAERLSQAYRQSFFVENRAGAGGLVGTDAVAKATPDGYTLLVSNAGSLGAGLSLYAKVPYDVLRDFAPVSLLADITIVLAVHPSVPSKNARELIALAKSQPGRLNAAIPGVGSIQHLVTALFRLRAGIDFVQVPYKGGGPALVDLMSGQADMSFINLPTIREFIRAGRLKAVAVASANRSDLLPDTPTLRESGLPDMVAAPWNAMMAPVATPREIVTRLNAEVVRIMRSPDMRQFLGAQGANALASTPEETHAFIREEIDKWARVVREAKIRLEG
jgi:tripartite-type tricarboxylate transporter receptor subunit TctC